MRFCQFETVDSTNAQALRMLNSNPPPVPFCVVAMSQTEGKGRGANRWVSPKGNLYISMVYEASANQSAEPAKPAKPAYQSDTTNQFDKPANSHNPANQSDKPSSLHNPANPQSASGELLDPAIKMNFCAGLAVMDLIQGFCLNGANPSLLNSYLNSHPSKSSPASNASPLDNLTPNKYPLDNPATNRLKSPNRLRSKCLLKWPNDILLGGEKVGGVLVEKHNRFAIVGVGVNLTNAPIKGSTSLFAHLPTATTTHRANTPSTAEMAPTTKTATNNAPSPQTNQNSPLMAEATANTKPAPTKETQPTANPATNPATNPTTQPASMARDTRDSAPLPTDIPQIAKRLVASFEFHKNQQDFSHIRNLWKAKAFGLGKQISLVSGGKRLQGEFCDINQNGALVLKTKQGIKALYAVDSSWGTTQPN